MTCAIISKSSVNVGIFNEYEPPYSKIKEQLRDTIWELYCSGYTEFYSNCEYGIPLWAAETVIALKMYNDIKLHIVMPYEEQSVNWGEEFRDMYFAVHEKADTVKIISNHYSDKCYDAAENYMIEKSDNYFYF